jgi:hypothetical protein
MLVLVLALNVAGLPNWRLPVANRVPASPSHTPVVIPTPASTAPG